MGWIADLLSLTKIRQERRKAKLEVAKLEAEARSRDARIVKAELADVERYDPKAKRIIDAIRARIKITPALSVGGWVLLIVTLIGALLLAFLMGDHRPPKEKTYHLVPKMLRPDGDPAAK